MRDNQTTRLLSAFFNSNNLKNISGNVQLGNGALLSARAFLDLFVRVVRG